MPILFFVHDIFVVATILSSGLINVYVCGGIVMLGGLTDLNSSPSYLFKPKKPSRMSLLQILPVPTPQKTQTLRTMPPNRSSQALPLKAGRLSGYNPLVLTPRRPARAAISLFYNWPTPRPLNNPDGLSSSSTRSVHFDSSPNGPWVPVDPSPQALLPLHPPNSFPNRPREPSVASLRRKSSGYSISTRLTRRQTPSEADFTDDEDEPQDARPDHSNRSVSGLDAPLSADSISEVRVPAEGQARVGPVQLDGHRVGGEAQIPAIPDLQG